ncbi:MAG TPA: ATP-binding protein, partial [Bdellovibrionales bacterium]|nr:ATP-binding protein [Bdellovibrionales bacterium]
SVMRLILDHLRGLWRARAYALRGIFCWLVGVGYLLTDYNGDFDLRFNLRPQQPIDPEIIVLYAEPEDWGAAGPRSNRQEALDQTDGYFWSTEGWNRMLKSLLAAQPKAIGVSYFFGAGSDFALGQQHLETLQDPRVIWAARVDSEGRALLPALARPYGLNTGVVDFRPGIDGVVRRLSSPLVHIPIFGQRLAERTRSRESSLPYGYSLHVNFRGPKGTFPTIRYRDLIEGKITAAHLKGKIVIVGSQSLANHQVLTPLGFMSRAEVLANTTDNILHSRWIRRFTVEVYALYLFAALLVVIWIILSYPQSVSTIFLGAFAIALAAVSVWWFDAFYFWIPISAPIIMIAVTFIVFLSFQLSVNEQKSWRLEQESRNMRELEQLKANFISLISHDLKTPIAKIQGITDRLLVSMQDAEQSQDLRALKQSSEELHKYIHSILQLSRVEARELKINKQAADINVLAEKAIAQIAPLARAKEIELAPDLEPLFSLEIDPVLIGEVILNLVDNAVKYTPAGGRVQVISREEGDEITVQVIDNGPGIPKDQLQRIWDKFYRVESQETGAKGSGLGLYLVRYFIELHGGRVFAESGETPGLKIGFYLPLEDVGGV